MEKEFNLARFFAWARPRAWQELEARLEADPTLDPNWVFSDIMQELLEEYRRDQPPQSPVAAPSSDKPKRDS